MILDVCLRASNDQKSIGHIIKIAIQIELANTTQKQQNFDIFG